MAGRSHGQPVSLAEALTIIDRVEPVAPREVELAAALGLTLAADAGTGGALRLAGARLRRVDLALLESQGVARVAVRAPRVLVAPRAAGELAVALVCGAIEAEGGTAHVAEKPPEVVLDGYDALTGIGNKPFPGARMEFENVGLRPGGDMAFGHAGGKPTLFLPAGMDGFAAWLAVGRRLLARLAFRLIEEQPYLLELARPLLSPRGVAEIVPVRRRAAQVEPMTGDAWSPQSLARADGWILVPAESDGLAAGSKVQMRLWP